MLNKRKIIPILIVSLFFVGLLLAQSSQAMAASNLSWGSRGSEVVQLQNTLNTKGYWCGAADGIFGSRTHNAVLKFQKDAGILVDGIVGPQTRSALGLSSSVASSRSSSSISRDGSTLTRGSRTLTVVATAYCPCSKCNYPYGGQPSYLGYPLKKGIVAVDPRVIALGSTLNIPGYGQGLAADTGGAIKGNRIDLCFSSHQEALNWGIKTVTITVSN